LLLTTVPKDRLLLLLLLLLLPSDQTSMFLKLPPLLQLLLLRLLLADRDPLKRLELLTASQPILLEVHKPLEPPAARAELQPREETLQVRVARLVAGS
jgi:hypothetical protein